MDYTGNVVRKPFATGSKSAHEAVWLVTDAGEFKLEREDGNPFRDPVLEELVGKRIVCRGIPIGATLRITDWTELR